MYVAFFILHEDFSKIKSNLFKSVFNVIQECSKDNNICHLYFHSSREVHKFDTYFKGNVFTNIVLHHIESNAQSERHRAVECYNTLLAPNPYEYHWIIKVRPDLLFFDHMIFSGIRQKYPMDSIQARARFYFGPKKLKKNEKSRWYESAEAEQESYKKMDDERLIILDDQVYMIPVGFQYHAFKSSKPGPSEQSFWMGLVSNQTSEKEQSLEWARRALPLKITEMHFVKLSDFDQYNLGL